MLDRRFLDVSIVVAGVSNSPAASPTAGTQYIVGSSPAGDFSGATANQLARYDGSKWIFSTPKTNGLEVLNVETKEVLSFDGTAWTAKTTLGGGGSSTNGAFLSDDRIFIVKCCGFTFPDTVDNVNAYNVGELAFVKATKKLYRYNKSKNWQEIPNGTIDWGWVMRDTNGYACEDYLPLFNGENSKFIDLQNQDIIIDLYSGEILKVDTGFWGCRKLADIRPKNVIAIGETGTVLPSTATKGDKFFNLNDEKIYTATDTDTWDSGKDEFGWFASTTDICLYYTHGMPAYTIAKVSDKQVFFNESDSNFYCYDATTVSFSKVKGDVPTTSASEFICETHTLTAEEATAKSFTLANSIKTGKETDVFLSVCGMVQIAGVDYTASGNTISWSDKTLADIGLQAGDVFLVQYTKA